MPNYNFVCLNCGITDERIMPMKKAVISVNCKCGVKMVRDFSKDTPFVSGGEYHRAIHSDSLAISPDQVAEHKRQFPNIRIDSECRPVFDNFNDHDSYLKKCGFKKERQRIRRSRESKVIA